MGVVGVKGVGVEGSPPARRGGGRRPTRRGSRVQRLRGGKRPNPPSPWPKLLSSLATTKSRIQNEDTSRSETGKRKGKNRSAGGDLEGSRSGALPFLPMSSSRLWTSDASWSRWRHRSSDPSPEGRSSSSRASWNRLLNASIGRFWIACGRCRSCLDERKRRRVMSARREGGVIRETHETHACTQLETRLAPPPCE